MSVTCKNILRSGEHPASIEKHGVCLCVCVLLQEALIFYFQNVNLCGPVWEVRGDKGEEKEGKSQ